MAAHEIFVSNIGCICRTEDHAEARKAFVDAVVDVKQNCGRASGEDVTWFIDQEIHKEHDHYEWKLKDDARQAREALQQIHLRKLWKAFCRSEAVKRVLRKHAGLTPQGIAEWVEVAFLSALLSLEEPEQEVAKSLKEIFRSLTKES